MVVFAVVDASLSPTSPLGAAIETFIRREDAERFVEDVSEDEPGLASYLPDRGAGARGGRGN